MDEPAIRETIENLRRIAERGIDFCADKDVDLWQHMLDEIQRLKEMI
jgi:hypothetical protein